jgi:hypothetical protein
VEKFKEIKELTRNNIVLKPHERSNSCEITSINRIQNVYALFRKYIKNNTSFSLVNKKNSQKIHCNTIPAMKLI